MTEQQSKSFTFVNKICDEITKTKKLNSKYESLVVLESKQTLISQSTDVLVTVFGSENLLSVPAFRKLRIELNRCERRLLNEAEWCLLSSSLTYVS